MRIGEVAEILDIQPFRVDGLVDRRIIRRVDDGVHRFTKAASGVESGTTIFTHPTHTEIVRGFPKTSRAMVLSPTIKRHFVDRVAVEEKMNGYNTRLAKVGEELVGLTRGGIVCPYTTYKAEEKIGHGFFDDHPDLVLCAEAVGPDNPYVPKSIYPEVDSFEFYVFDIRRKNTGEPLPLPRKRDLIEEYGLNGTRFFGTFSVEEAPGEVQRIIRDLGREAREGVVMKDPQMMVEPIKYTTSQSNCADLQYAFKYYNDYGQSFFFSRVVREAFQTVEWEESEEERRERYHRLGESVLEPMIETIERVAEGGRALEDVYIRVGDLRVAEEMRSHLKRMGVETICEEPVEVGDGEYRVRIHRFHQSTTDKTSAVLEGDLW